MSEEKISKGTILHKNAKLHHIFLQTYPKAAWSQMSPRTRVKTARHENGDCITAKL